MRGATLGADHAVAEGLGLQSVCNLVAIRTSARRNASKIKHGEGRGPVASPVFKSRSSGDSNQDAPTTAESFSMLPVRSWLLSAGIGSSSRTEHGQSPVPLLEGGELGLRWLRCSGVARGPRCPWVAGHTRPPRMPARAQSAARVIAA